MAIYWIDAGVLITAKNGHYGFDLVPKFWTFMDDQLTHGIVRMPKMAFQEVIDGNDELTKWCKERKSIGHFCVKSSKSVQQEYSRIADFVYEKHKPHQAAEFLKGADGWIVAHAIESHGFVVTEETVQHYKSKVKIPNICKAFDVPWKTTVDLCRELKASF